MKHQIKSLNPQLKKKDAFYFVLFFYHIGRIQYIHLFSLETGESELDMESNMTVTINGEK